MKIATLLLLFSLSLIAQPQTKKQLVFVADTCEDPVGSSVLFQFKEAVRTSASYTLDELSKRPIWVEIVCVDASMSASAPATAISITAHFFKETGSCMRPVQLYHGVRYTTIHYTKETAIGILAAIDAENSKHGS